MWDNLLLVDWGNLTHAYGRAHDMPDILRNMIAQDEKARAAGWDAFWGSINHQGDFYDSTAAAIPFLIEAVARPGVPERASILYYFRDRWLEAPSYGGDPLVTEPPGGEDIPTPMLTQEALAAASGQSPGDDEEFDVDSYRRMDLCAWQTARAIPAGRPTFESLLDDPDREVAAAAAALLLLWPQTRALGKQALVRAVADEGNLVEQARRILEFGIYATSEDVGVLKKWAAPHWPAPTQAAAALVWAWVVNPAPLPERAAAALHASSAPGSDGFGKLPWVGVYEHGPWALPANAAALILRLAESRDKEIRWRAVQGLATSRETAKSLSAAQVVPVLLNRLSDDYNRIRAAAALALAQRGEAVLDTEPGAVPALISALEEYRSQDWGDTVPGLDADASVCGHAARLLVALSRRLTPAQRQEALAGVERAARRYAGRDNDYVSFNSMGVGASQFLSRQCGLLARPAEWGLTELFAAFAFPDNEDAGLSPGDCDRKLADAYARAPEQAIAGGIEAVRAASNRNAAIGAALWLMTLGPAAEAALEALDGMAGGQLDSYAQDQARAASSFIRQSLLLGGYVTCDAGGEESDGEPSARRHVARLLCAVAEADPAGRGRGALLADLTGLLEHPDAYVRAGAAEGLATLTPAPEEVAAAAPVLERMLADEAFAEVGVAGEYVCEGRLYHWRQECRSPRAGAVRALFAVGGIPRDDRVLKAMLAESTRAKVVCGKSAAPRRFAVAQWRLAADAAGGLSAAEPLIRATRQQLQNQRWPGNKAPYVCAAELAEIIRRLSGRLV